MREQRGVNMAPVEPRGLVLSVWHVYMRVHRYRLVRFPVSIIVRNGLRIDKRAAHRNICGIPLGPLKPRSSPKAS